MLKLYYFVTVLVFLSLCLILIAEYEYIYDDEEYINLLKQAKSIGYNPTPITFENAITLILILLCPILHWTVLYLAFTESGWEVMRNKTQETMDKNRKKMQGYIDDYYYSD